jgi:Fic family protein
MYIHERENWTNFFWDNDKLSPILASIRHLQGRLLGRMESLGFDFIARATLESLILDVVDTSRIEGEFLNPELVRSSIARKLGIENADFTKTPRNIEGIVDVILDATQNFDKPLSETRLLGWNQSLLTKCSTDTALRDLQDLVAKEMLKAEDSGKKTNYVIVSPKNIRIPQINGEITPAPKI